MNKTNSVDKVYQIWDLVKLIATFFIIACIGMALVSYVENISDKEKQTARQEGYEEGYEKGYAEAVEEYSSHYSDGYSNGYDEGYNAGYTYGYDIGKDESEGN